MTELLILLAIALAGTSGLPGLFLGRRSNVGQLIATSLNLSGCALGLWAAFRALLHRPGEGLSVPLAIPGAELSVGVDALSAAFLVPIFFISGLGDIYGLEYWGQSEHPRNGRRLRLFYGLLTSGLALLVVARNGFCFLLGWEIMALSNFFAMTAEDDKPEVRQAGWIYFTSTHLSVLMLFAFFALYFLQKGSLALDPFRPGTIAPGMANALFILAVGGFGLKAGLFPLHFWLPPAHAAAPSHVSGIMSGVVIKMGVYGMARAAWLFPEAPLWWGECLLVLGGISGVLGVVFAIGQHDLKRLLAYHSIENVGIIFMGLGLGLAGRSRGRMEWIALGLGGAILHSWNHGFFKSLLFLSAGSAIHAAHTREIDHLGGLAKRMPITALLFLVGAVAICGLPPLNGFVSELLIYLGLFHAFGGGPGVSLSAAPVAIAVLALIGGLALTCFVKVYGAVFLGEPRTEHPQAAHESGAAMIGPMALLAAVCALIGLAPMAVAPFLDAAIAGWSPLPPGPDHALSAVAPLGWLSGMGLTALTLIVIGLAAIPRRKAATAVLGTWDCGYARPSSRIQYTASSFAQMVMDLFAWAVLPRTHRSPVAGLFPAQAKFQSWVPDIILERAILPVFAALAWACSWFRLLQRGRINAYLLYIFITLLVLLLWK